MPKHSIQDTLLALHINAQCDCACPDGSCPEQATPAPLIAYLELTSLCNNHCLGCPNPFTFRQKENSLTTLSVNQWSAILERLLPHVQRVKLTGGEPTLYPHFLEIINLLDDMALPFDLFTNGRWREPKKILHLLSKSRYFGGCLTSLHGPSTDSHEAFNKTSGSFQETVGNIRLAINDGIPVVLSTIITQRNYFLIDDLLALGEDLGVSHIVFNRYLGYVLPEISPTPAQLIQAVRHIEHRRAEGYRVKFSVCIPRCFIDSSSQGCLAGVTTCTIDPLGNMRPCNHAPLIIGNLLRQNLRKLWYSNAIKQWRNLPEQCEDCSMNSTCRGGCRAQAMLTGKKYDHFIDTSVHKRALLGML